MSKAVVAGARRRVEVELNCSNLDGPDAGRALKVLGTVAWSMEVWSRQVKVLERWKMPWWNGITAVQDTARQPYKFPIYCKLYSYRNRAVRYTAVNVKTIRRLYHGILDPQKVKRDNTNHVDLYVST